MVLAMPASSKRLDGEGADVRHEPALRHHGDLQHQDERRHQRDHAVAELWILPKVASLCLHAPEQKRRNQGERAQHERHGQQFRNAEQAQFRVAGFDQRPPRPRAASSLKTNSADAEPPCPPPIRPALRPYGKKTLISSVIRIICFIARAPLDQAPGRVPSTRGSSLRESW